MSEIPKLLQPVSQQPKQEKTMLAQSIERSAEFDFISSMETVAGIDSKEFGKATQLSKLTGLNSKDLYDRRETVEKIQKRDRYGGLYRKYQKTADALRDGNTAAVTKDDIDFLVRIEGAFSDARFNRQSTGEKLWGAVEQQFRTLSQGAAASRAKGLVDWSERFDAIDAEIEAAAAAGVEPYADKARPAGFGFDYLTATPEQRLVMRENLGKGIKRRADQIIDNQKALEAAPVEPTARKIENMKADGMGSFDASLEGAASDPAYIGRLAVGAAAGSAEMLAGGVIGGIPLAALFGFNTEYNAKFIDVIREAKVDLTDPKAIVAAFQNEELMNDAGKRSALKAAGTTAVDMLSMGLASKLLVPAKVGGRELGRTGRELTNLAVQMPVQGLTEAASEAAGSYLADGEVDGGELLLEGLAGAAMSSVDVAVFSNRRLIEAIGTTVRNRRIAAEDASALDEAVESAKSMESLNVAPDVLAGVFKRQLEGTRGETVSIPASALQQLNQSGKVNLPEILERVAGLPEQFAEAAASGGSVTISGADYLVHFRDYHEDIRDGVRLGSDGLSATDADALNAELEQRIDELAESLKVDKGEALTIGQTLMGELISAGYRRQDAEQYVATHMNVMQTLAERTGQAVEQVAKQFALGVGSEKRKQLRSIPLDDARLAIQRLRSGDVPKAGDIRGQSLLEFLRANGGINDEGGELAALDVDVGKRGAARLTRKGGKTLDHAATLAREFGYFSGVDPSQVTPQLIVDAIQSELAGDPVYSDEQFNSTLQEQAAMLEDLGDYLSQLGVELDTMSDDEVLDVVQGIDRVAEAAEAAFDAPETVRLNQFAGQNALTANQEALAEAVGRLANGEDPEQVRKDTGWFVGVDNKWKFEISDADARLGVGLESLVAHERAGERITSVTYRNGGGLWKFSIVTDGMKVPSDFIEFTTLNPSELRPLIGNDLIDRALAGEGELDPFSDDGSMYIDGHESDLLNSYGGKKRPLATVLDHSALYDAYPELMDTPVIYAPDVLPRGVVGALAEYGSETVIVLGNVKNRAEARKTVIHEVQHLIQRIEGFARGGASDAFDSPSAKARILAEDYEHKMARWGERHPAAYAGYLETKRLMDVLENDYGNPDGEHAQRDHRYVELEAAREAMYSDDAAFANMPFPVSSDTAALDIYYRLAGEIEARNVEARAHMTDEIIKLIPPEKTADTPDSEAIVVMGERAGAPESFNLGSMTEDQYIAAINPTGKRLDDSDRPTIYAGDIEGALPYGAVKLPAKNKTRDGRSIDLYRTDDGALWAMVDGLEAGYMSALSDTETDLSVAQEFQGQGIGAALSTEYRRANPLAQSGGLTEAGERTARAAFRRLQGDTVRLNQSSAPIGTPHSEAKTGNPMRVYFARNTVSSKGNAPAGMDFGQKIEPAGEYMVIQDSDMSDQGGDGWTYGLIEFSNPLVLEHKSTGSNGWKKDLSEMFGGKTGKSLANAVKKAGYDAIVTIDGKYGYSETVNLSGVKSEPAPTTRLNQSALPETIEIDGVDRPTQNSNGQPIAQTEEGIRNFWKWFGDSQVVDDQGRPLVVYHGTAREFAEFKDEAQGDNFADYDGAFPRDGFWFTSEPDNALWYANVSANGLEGERAGGGQRTIPTFVSANNPYRYTVDMFAEEGEAGIPSQLELEEQGYDGIIVEISEDDDGSSTPAEAEAMWQKYTPIHGAPVSWPADLREQYFDLLDVPPAIKYTHYVAFRPEQIKSAIGNNGNFDPSNPNILEQGGDDNARGFITFQPRRVAGEARQFQITLGEKRDLSTLLHELGHYYLEVMTDLAAMPDANAQIVADVEKIRAWVGNDGGKLTVDQHEQFARGFEAYLAEGKAPAPELAGAFARFKRWIIQVYKDLSRLDVELTDEIRGVFDRMVATDEQIADAERISAALPMFTDAVAASMSDADFARYNDTIAAAHADAQSTIERQIVAEEERRRSKWWAEESEKVRAEIEEELDVTPVYAAMKALRTGVMPDGSAVSFKLNSGELTERYGYKAIRKLAMMYSREGISPEIVAPMFGFDSGDDMVKAMLGAVPRGEMLKQETELRMNERHGMKPDGEAAEAAMYAVHNDRRADVLRIELEALGKLGNRKNITSQQVLKEAAKRSMAGRTVRSIQPIDYQRAEAKASREAFSAAARGDLEAAYEAKQRQLLNFHLYREAVKARESVAAITKRMNELGKAKTRQRLGKAGHDYLDQIDGILEQYEFRTVSLRQIDKRKSVATWYDEQVKAGNDPVVPAFVLASSQRTNYKELSLEQLIELDDFAQNIKHLAGLKNKLLKNKRYKEISELRADLAAAAFANVKDRHERPLVNAMRTLPQAARDWIKKGNSSLLKMEQVIDWLDGSDVNGPWATGIFRPLAEAQHHSDKLNKEVGHKLAKLHADWIEARGSKIGQIFKIQSLGQSMPTTAILAVAVNVGNASNHKKMLEGMGWKQHNVDEILGHMTKADWDYVQALWETVSSLWPEVEALEKRVNGVAPPKIEGVTIETPFGSVTGGYWPMIYDTMSTKYADSAARREDGSAPLGEGGAVARAPSRGFTQARVDNFSAPIVLDIGIVGNHMTEVIHDLTHREVLRDVRAAFTGEAREAVSQTLGPEIAAQIVNQFDGIARSASADDVKAISTFSAVMTGLRTNQALAWMGYSITTILNQFAGYAQAMEYFAQRGERRYLIKALFSFWSNPIGNLAMIRSMSGEMENRAINLDASIREASKTVVRMKDGRFMSDALKTAGDARDVMVKYAFVPMQVVQGVIDGVVWSAAYEAAGGHTDHDNAVAAADRAVRMTQTAGGAKDLATIQQNNFAKLFMPVYGYLSLLWNRNNDLARDFGRGIKERSPKQVLVAFERFVYLNILPTLIAGAIKGELPDDDDDENDDKLLGGWAEYVALESIKSVTGGIPLVGPAVSGALSPFGYSGASPVGQGVDAALMAFGASKGQTVTTSAITAVGMFTGIPSSQINRAVRTAFMTESGEMDDAALNIVRGVLLGPVKKD